MHKRVLLDTSIVVHGEISSAEYCRVRRLYRWMDMVDARRVIHPETAARVRPKSWQYQVLPHISRHRTQRLDDRTPHFNALLSGGADLFVTEDSLSRPTAGEFGLGDRVLSIEQFIRYAARTALGRSNPGELPITEELFCNFDVSSPFFGSLRRDYPDFERWFARKSMQTAYACRDYDGELMGFLFLKCENEDESYDDISPPMSRARRLKIGTLKVSCAGLGLGGRFMRIALDVAMKDRASEIYSTFFTGRRELDSLIPFMQKWGFCCHGVKLGAGGAETVMRRSMTPGLPT